jgi:hypothetical protein
VVIKEKEVVFEEIEEMLGGAVVVLDETVGFSEGTQGDWGGRVGDRGDEALGGPVLEGSQIAEIKLNLFSITNAEGWEIGHVRACFDTFKSYS